MNIICLDMEGVLTPEIWPSFADVTGIEEFRMTTRQEPDYDKLMRMRIEVLRKNKLGIKEIQDTISKIDLLPGAVEFVDELRKDNQVIILSDTFYQFAYPLMKKLNYPALFCNELLVDEDGFITEHRMRCEKSKLTTVKGLQSIGFDTIAAGDSHNDVGMILASKAGFFFRGIDTLKEQYPQIPCFEEYDDLLKAIKGAL